MRIHALCIIKNEADVIEESLRAAARWCDHIYVWDNGSTDGTWEIVNSLSRSVEQIVPWKQQDTTFGDGLRGEIFREFRHRASDDDWWCLLPADEFYVIDPRAFLSGVPERYGVVWYASLSYYFSSVAADEYRRDPDAFSDSIPVAERCRYYLAHWSEPRFARHTALADWPEDLYAAWPPSINAVEHSPVRILAKHFAYRSPAQIEARIATRAAAALSGRVFAHEAVDDWSNTIDPEAIAEHKWKDLAYVTEEELLQRGWESRVVPAASLSYDAHDGRFTVDLNSMPAIPEPPLAQEITRILGRIGRAARRRLLRR